MPEAGAALSVIIHASELFSDLQGIYHLLKKECLRDASPQAIEVLCDGIENECGKRQKV